jgi:hypothetical protein
MPPPTIGLDKFIQRANEVHGDQYVYTNSVYIGARNKIDIICKVHGPFSQRSSDHLQGKGCPKCGKYKTRKIRYSQNEDATWKPVPGFTNYEASTLGEVRNIHTKHVLSTRLNAEGYLLCDLTSDEGNAKSWRVHRVIALTFLPNPYNLPTVNHINLIRNDNRLENLEWADMKYQNQHRGPSKLQTLRRVLQVDPSTNEIVHTFEDIREAAEYLISNKLTKSIKKENAMKNLRSAIVKKQSKRYKFFWTYEASTEIQNELWKVVGNVQVSNKGRVKKKDGSITYGTDSHGYKCVTIQGKCVKIHQLVAILFIPNPNNLPIVNHLDGNKTNNDVSNLVWSTHAENVQHAQDTGLNSGCKRVRLVELNQEFPSIASAARWIQEQTHLEEDRPNFMTLRKRITVGKAGEYTWEVADQLE